MIFGPVWKIGYTTKYVVLIRKMMITYQFQGYPIFRQIHLVKDLFLVDLGGNSLISTSYTKNYAAPVKNLPSSLIIPSFLAIDLKCLVPQNVQSQFFWPKSNLFGGCFNINIPIHSQYISYILITLNIHHVTLATLNSSLQTTSGLFVVDWLG